MRSEVADDLRRVGVGERRAVEMGLRHYRARLPRLIGVVGQRNTACPVACTARRVEEVSSEDGVRLKRVSCKRGRRFSKLALVGIITDHSLSLFSDKERGADSWLIDLFVHFGLSLQGAVPKLRYQNRPFLFSNSCEFPSSPADDISSNFSVYRHSAESTSPWLTVENGLFHRFCLEDARHFTVGVVNSFDCDSDKPCFEKVDEVKVGGYENCKSLEGERERREGSKGNERERS